MTETIIAFMLGLVVGIGLIILWFSNQMNND